MADAHGPVDTHEEHHQHPPYLFIFGLLCLFTALSWFADESKSMMPGRGTLAVIVLAIAAMKATCVMLYFMHLKFERAWKYLLLAPTTILAIGLPLALLPDIGVNYYDVDVPQRPLVNQPVEHTDGEAAGGGGHGGQH